jgi:hypothetical protein
MTNYSVPARLPGFAGAFRILREVCVLQRGSTSQTAPARGHILATLDHELRITHVNHCEVFSQLDGNSAV